jgi:hypothetical protein
MPGSAASSHGSLFRNSEEKSLLREVEPSSLTLATMQSGTTQRDPPFEDSRLAYESHNRLQAPNLCSLLREGRRGRHVTLAFPLGNIFKSRMLLIRDNGITHSDTHSFVTSKPLSTFLLHSFFCTRKRRVVSVLSIHFHAFRVDLTTSLLHSHIGTEPNIVPLSCFKDHLISSVFGSFTFHPRSSTYRSHSRRHQRITTCTQTHCPCLPWSALLRLT